MNDCFIFFNNLQLTRKLIRKHNEYRIYVYRIRNIKIK